MKEWLQVLKKQRIQAINDQSIISPLPKAQRIIYEAFDITMPSSN